MTESDNDTGSGMLAKIRLLLAQAQGTDNELEQNTYNEKAAALIAKYGIDQAMLAVDDPTSDQIGHREFVVEAPYSIDKRGLLCGLARSLRCRNVFWRVWHNERWAYRVRIYGFESDLERVDILYTSLLIQAHRGVTRRIPAEMRGLVTPVMWRKSWMAGFAGIVERRIEQAERRAQEQAETATQHTGRPGVALVLLDRSAAVERHFKAEHPGVKVDRRRRHLDREGYRAGAREGASADLGTSRLAGTTRQTRGELGSGARN